MATEKQIQAARIKGAKSKGPVTVIEVLLVQKMAVALGNKKLRSEPSK